MKVKRSIAIPAPLLKWLQERAEKEGLSVSALITQMLMAEKKRG